MKTKTDSPTGVPVQRLVRQNTTTMDRYWMMRKFANGHWVCDTGSYDDRSEVEEAIARRPAPDPGVEYVPVRITETTVAEYDAA